MKIIKQGKIPVTTKVFNCDYCRCEFEAEKGEYEACSQMEILHDGLPAYKCVCPCCGIMVYEN